MNKNQMLSIYLVEDESLIRNWLKTELIKMGHRIAGEAADGETALKSIIESKPNFLILDINLPGIDGLSVVKEIQKHMIIPVVIITGYSAPEIIMEANELGVFGYLIKPLDANELHSTIMIAYKRFNEFQSIQNSLNNTKNALEERKYIERAKGILMDRFGLPENQAMQYIQRKSRNTNQKLIKVAQEIILSEKLIL